MTITVYTKPQCMQCRATFKTLDKHAIDYTAIDVTSDPDALEYVTELGYSSVPVVVTDTAHWGGYRPDTLSALIQDQAATGKAASA